MSYKTETLIAQAQNARKASGISQRSLSDRTGMTQSHISHIESGKAEPGLSSFIDITRALDLELVLVPKKSLPAVEGLIKAQTAHDGRVHANQVNEKLFSRAERMVKKMTQIHGSSAELDRIAQNLRLLRKINLSDQEMRHLRELIALLERHQASSPGTPAIRAIAQSLQRLRNTLAQGEISEPRPAYTLDDGDEDDHA